MEQIPINNDTIAAISTPSGVGGIAVIRVSGPQALEIVNSAWSGSNLLKVKSHTVHLGKYLSVEGNLLDEAVASVFISPASFTGENVVEVGVHGSSWIQREILKDLVKRGVRIANPGEFTQRAFLNGKMDLAQAEGVADLIASSSRAAHDLAISQTKGIFSKEFSLLREKLIEFASLMELELDFSEEDVEFADRSQLISLCEEILTKINKLISSYSNGSVLKNGVPVVIAGIPNAGKSSLLNLLLGDEKAIVTDIPGTTRDIIEDTVEIDGILYRFVDTAGIRETQDIVEGIGVDRALTALEKAYIVVWVLDPTSPMDSQIKELKKFVISHPSKNLIILLNKSDLTTDSPIPNAFIPNPQNLIPDTPPILFSTLTGAGLNELLEQLKSFATAGQNLEKDVIVTNARHYEALTHAYAALNRVKETLSPISKSSDTSSASVQNSIDQTLNNLDFTINTPDLLAQDIREAISYLSEITGSITSDNLLHSIFSRFCIGK